MRIFLQRYDAADISIEVEADNNVLESVKAGVGKENVTVMFGDTGVGVRRHQKPFSFSK